MNATKVNEANSFFTILLFVSFNAPERTKMSWRCASQLKTRVQHKFFGSLLHLAGTQNVCFFFGEFFSPIFTRLLVVVWKRFEIMRRMVRITVEKLSLDSRLVSTQHCNQLAIKSWSHQRGQLRISPVKDGKKGETCTWNMHFFNFTSKWMRRKVRCWWKSLTTWSREYKRSEATKKSEYEH